MQDLTKLSKSLSLTTIRLEYIKCKLDKNLEIDPPNALDNIINISMELNVQDENSNGWIYTADWKNLKKLTVQDFNESENYPWHMNINQLSANFKSSTWSPRFLQLRTISIRLVKIPFPYVTFKSLLESPNLMDLSVVLYNKDASVQDFDANDFQSHLKHRKLNITHLRLLKRHSGISCALIIPFGSFLNLIDSTPNLCKIEANLNQDQVDKVMQKFNVTIEKAVDFDAMFDPDFDIESENSDDSDYSLDSDN